MSTVKQLAKERMIELGTEWAFFGMRAANVFPKGYGGMSPGDSRDKSSHAYWCVEDALLQYSRENQGNHAYARRPRWVLGRMFKDGAEVTDTERNVASDVMRIALRYDRERSAAFEAA